MKAENIEIPFDVGMSGRFRLRVAKASAPDVTVRDTGWFDNIIVDTGLNGIGTSGMTGACQVGTGSATPVSTDTGLQSYVAGAGQLSVNFSAQGSTPYFGSNTKIYRFAAGTAAGNLSEVAIAQGTTNGSTLFSRALILDGGGSPTTITVLSDEILDVYYELRLYPPLTDVVGTYTIGGVSTTVTLRAADVTDANTWGQSAGEAVAAGTSTTLYDGAIGAITSNPSGLSAGGSMFVTGAYSNNSKERAFHADFGLSIVIVATAARLTTNYGNYQIGFSPGINKLNTQLLSINIKINWARKTLP